MVDRHVMPALAAVRLAGNPDETIAMKTDLTEKELGMVQVALKRFNSDVLPALRAMKDKVDRGETLNEREMAQLEDAIKRGKRGDAFADKHPDYRSLVDSANDIYNDIKTRSAANAGKSDD